ncbi:MAG TPA: hypothetical protein VK461_06275 [Acidimicrobiales bacterium]|nr:hypothetical protein [Acidimicrobiales bacterium]
MEMSPYVEELQQQLLSTAELGGDDARALAERLVPHLDGMVRLVLLDALSAAAAEITTEMAPGSVSVRLRGREAEFDVIAPLAPAPTDDVAGGSAPPPDAEEGEVARITLRLPENLKTQVEQAASRERLSVNAWLVRAVASALDGRRRDPRPTTPSPYGGQRLSGWAR